MSRHNRYALILLLTVSIVTPAGVLLMAFDSAVPVEQAVRAGRAPALEPDFGDAVIPPNIAPLNFLIRETGSRYLVRIRSQQGDPVEVVSRSAKIAIPKKRWRRLLAANRGQTLEFEVFVQAPAGAGDAKAAGSPWRRFEAVRVRIAPEDIDGFLVYRRIRPVHSAWREMGIYQRDLRSFRESTVLTNDYFAGGCVNCHTFCNNRTDTMLLSTRSPTYSNSAVIVRDGVAQRIGTTFGYTAWHPSGKLVTYSVNKVVLFLHPAGDEVRDVLDLDSLLACYDVDSEKVKTTPDIARKDRLETYPTWSPDGRFLYFCSAPLTWTNRKTIPAGFREIKYDLMRIGYDLETDTWGPLETVLTAAETGRSILLPRVSPDGRWLLFCMCEYGCFPVYQQSSDLYLIDLDAARRTGRYEYRRLDINSDESESWHSWSSNSRWIAFSSKRDNGRFTRTYLSYVDPNGTACRPLLLPQEDPTHYGSCLWTYSVPELVCEPVPLTREKLGRVVRGKPDVAVRMPITMATPKAEATPATQTPYQSTRE